MTRLFEPDSITTRCYYFFVPALTLPSSQEREFDTSTSGLECTSRMLGGDKPLKPSVPSIHHQITSRFSRHCIFVTPGLSIGPKWKFPSTQVVDQDHGFSILSTRATIRPHSASLFGYFLAIFTYILQAIVHFTLEMINTIETGIGIGLFPSLLSSY